MVKRGTGADIKYRLCVDYRKLNAVTIAQLWPVQRIDGLLSELSGSKLFTSLDLDAAYHQVAFTSQ